MALESGKKSPNIDLYTLQTANGIKISIVLEELGYFRDLVLSAFS